MKFFKKISSLLKSILGTSFNFLRKNSVVAVRATNALKNFVESPVAAAIVNIIPGEVDDYILFKLRRILPIITAEMAIAHGILTSGAKTHSVLLAEIIEHLKAKNVEGRAGFYIELSGRINLALSDGLLTLPEAVALAQITFAEIKMQKDSEPDSQKIPFYVK